MKAAIINFTGGRENWGCQATSDEMLRFCRGIIARWPQSEIMLVPCLPKHALDSFIERVHGKRIRRIFAAECPRPSDLRFLEGLVEQRFGAMIERVRSSDIVIFQGEGTMGPKVHFRGLRFFALPFLAKHLWRKPVVSLNQSFYAARPSDLAVAANIYRHFDIVALREGQSYALYRGLGVGQPLLCPDLAFRARPADGAGHEVDSPYFCVTGSAAMDEYDLGAYALLIGELAASTGLRPLLLYSKQDDARLLSAVAEALPAGTYAAINSKHMATYDAILPILRDARFVIGGRYHTAVTALAQATPVILLPANTHKNEGLATMLGIDLPVHGIADRHAILAEAQVLMRPGNGRADAIRKALDTVAARQEAFANHLAGFLAGGDRAGGIDPLLIPDIPAATVRRQNAAIYAQVNAGRSHSLIGRLKGTQRQLGAWHLVRTQLKRRSLRKLKPYVSMTANRRIYDRGPGTPP